MPEKPVAGVTNTGWVAVGSAVGALMLVAALGLALGFKTPQSQLEEVKRTAVSGIQLLEVRMVARETHDASVDTRLDDVVEGLNRLLDANELQKLPKRKKP